VADKKIGESLGLSGNIVVAPGTKPTSQEGQKATTK
jgi:hypothetical protein